MGDGNIDALANPITREYLLCVEGPTSNSVTICRVPERLRMGESDAYEPQIISLGPYHQGKQRLEAMQEYKWHHLKAILS